MVSITSNPRLENWIEIDKKMNWTDLENTLGPRTWTFGLNEEQTRTLGLENLDLTDIESRTRNRTQCLKIWI